MPIVTRLLQMLSRTRRGSLLQPSPCPPSIGWIGSAGRGAAGAPLSWFCKSALSPSLLPDQGPMTRQPLTPLSTYLDQFPSIAFDFQIPPFSALGCSQPLRVHERYSGVKTLSTQPEVSLNSLTCNTEEVQAPTIFRYRSVCTRIERLLQTFMLLDALLMLKRPFCLSKTSPCGTLVCKRS